MTCLLCCPASATCSLVTFKLLPCCRLRDEQKCQCVMTNKQCLYHVLILSLLDKRGKVYLHRKEMWARKPQAHTKNCRCDAAKYDIVPQIKVNPSKATCFFSLLLLSVNSLSLSHTGPAAIRCLSSMYPSNPTSPPVPATSLSPSVYHRADRQHWGWIAPSASEVCSSV